MALHKLIEGLELRIKNVENSVATTLNNYHGLSGMLSGLKETLTSAHELSSSMAPDMSFSNEIGADGHVNSVTSELIKE